MPVLFLLWEWGPRWFNGERVDALAQGCEISQVTENAAPFAARDLFDNAEPFQIGERRIDRGGGEARLLNDPGGRHRALLKQIVDAQRRTGPIAFYRWAVPRRVVKLNRRGFRMRISWVLEAGVSSGRVTQVRPPMKSVAPALSSVAKSSSATSLHSPKA